MRCQACGAHNAQDASWCTQCYASFGRVETHAVDPADPGTATPEAATSGPGDSSAGLAPTPSTRSVVAGSSASQDRAVREIDGQVEWRCATCEAWTALEEAACGTCSAPRAGFGDLSPDAVVPDVADRTVLGASALVPGLGHILLGRAGSGITRTALWALWAAGGLWWVLTTENARRPGLVLLGGAAIMWVAAVVDANAIVQGSKEPFGARGLLWTVVGVTGLLMVVIAFIAAGSVGG